MTQRDLVAEFEAAAGDPARVATITPAFRFAKVKPTDNCNSRCLTCTYWQHKYENELSGDEIRRVLADLRALGVEEVTFTGGEPTLRKDLPDMVAEAKALEFTGVGMTTNGLSLGGGRIERLIDAGLTEVVLSFEGPRVHDEIRGVPGNTEKILGHLRLLDALRAAGRLTRFSVKLGMTLMQRTLGEVPAILDLARDYGAAVLFNLIDKGTYFFEGVPGDLFAIDDLDELDRTIDLLVRTKLDEPRLIGNSLASLEYARRYFRDPKQANIPCYLGHVGIEVDANGDVYSNCWGLPPVGNVRGATLPEIVAAPAFRQRLVAMYNKQCAGCSCGYVLNLAYHPESAADGQPQGFGYAGERY